MFFSVVIGYLVLLVVLAWVGAKRMRDLQDFFLAGRKLPTLALALTFVAAWFGAGSTMGTMGGAYLNGLSAAWLIPIPSVLTCILVGTFIAQKVREQSCFSLPEAIETHYGRTGSIGLALALLASSTAIIGSQLVAASAFMETTLGLSPLWSVVMILVAVIIYSVIGGFRAVVMTDVMQFIFFTAAILILFAFVWLNPPLLHAPERVGTFWRFDLDIPFHLAQTLTFVAAWIIAPEMWQRVYAAPQTKDARKMVYTAGFILMCLYTLVLATGMMATHHIIAGKIVGDPNKVLLTLANQLPHPALTALVLVGVLSAITSTIDSSLNVSAMTFTRNILHRFIHPQATPERLVLYSRLSTVLITVPAAMIALHYQDIIHILWIAADILACTMTVPVLGLLYRPDSGKLPGILAMCFGAAVIITNLLINWHWINPIQNWPTYPYTTLFGLSLSLLGFALGVRLSRK